MCGRGGTFTGSIPHIMIILYTQQKKVDRNEKIIKKKDEHVALVFNLYQKKKKNKQTIFRFSSAIHVKRDGTKKYRLINFMKKRPGDKIEFFPFFFFNIIIITGS